MESQAAATTHVSNKDRDASAPYKLLLSCPLGLSPSQVSVDFDGSHDRIPHPDIDLENSISELSDGVEVWSYGSGPSGRCFEVTYLSDMGPKNSQKYISVQWDEVQGFITHKEGSGSDKISSVSLHLGLTDYRTFVGTNLNPLWEKFLVPSNEDTIRCQHTSSPLGNGAIVETLDKKILVLRRSNNVGEFPGHFVFPGGHPEPQEIGIACHQPGKSLTESEMLNKGVSEEMFDSIVREVNEEIGAPGSSLGNPLFIGISRREMNVRPAAFFFMTCTLHSDEIQKCYSSAQDGFESTQLYAVTLVDLESLASKMPGCHQGGLALYKLMLEAGKDVR